MPNRHPATAASALVLTLALTLGGAGAAQAGPAGAKALAKVQKELARQAQLIQAQQAEIDALKAERGETLAAIRAAGPGGGDPPPTRIAAADPVPNAVVEAPPVRPVSPGPTGPVGERPADQPRREVAAIPPELGVLTPKGHLVLDPSVEYIRSSNNRLVFRGVEIVPGIQVGAIEASDVAQDSSITTLAARYGVTHRLEVEVRVPYVWRDDRVTTLAQLNATRPRSDELSGHDLGDVEFAARYQINSGANGGPIFVATSRIKPPTGTGPYDSAGIATSLATGSGFWAAEGGVTMLYPTDPAIIFGGLTYLHNFGRDVDRTIGSGDAATHVGRVDPGDSIGASLGFGLALNPRFSVSLGYSHNYIFKTSSQLGDTKSTTQPLQVGSLLMGWSFRLNERLTLNNSFEFGVTSDAPDLRIVLRAPYRF
jgi:hypothetical protein